jgi:circadian clock protein KaiC
MRSRWPTLSYARLVLTVLGELLLKMLLPAAVSYFDIDKINTLIKFVNLAADLLDGEFDRAGPHPEEVESLRPACVPLWTPSLSGAVGQLIGTKTWGLHFIQALGVQMTSWYYAFLIGEYPSQEETSSLVFTVADGIIWMLHAPRRHGAQAASSRCARPSAPDCTPSISDDGSRCFHAPFSNLATSRKRMLQQPSSDDGVPLLDKMRRRRRRAIRRWWWGRAVGGKSVLSTEFLAACAWRARRDCRVRKKAPASCSATG